MESVVLELFGGMPENCSKCTLSCKQGEDWVCGGYDIKVFVDFKGTTRSNYCPLKVVEIIE